MAPASRRKKKEAGQPQPSSSKRAAPVPVPVVVPVQSSRTKRKAGRQTEIEVDREEVQEKKRSKNKPGPASRTRVSSDRDSEVESSPEEVEGESAVESDNEAQSDPEVPDGSDVEEARNEGNEGADNNRNRDQEAEEEEPFLERFPRFISTHSKKDEKKKIKVVKEVKKFKSKKENPLRAELFNSMMKYVKNDIRRVEDLFPDISANEFRDLARSSDSLSPSENVKHQVVKLVNYSLEQYQQKYLHNLIANLQLKHCIGKRESLEWSGYEMKINSNDPSHEFREKPGEDQLTLTPEESSAIRKDVRAKVKRALSLLTTDSDTKMVTQVMSCEDFIALNVLKIKNTRTRRAEKNSYSSVYGAFNPKLPYLFIHGKGVSEKLILALVKSAGGQYRTFVDLNLKDIGLDTVYSSCLKISTAHYTGRVQQLLTEENENSANENIPTLTGFEQPEKRRKLMKALIDDKQAGGFKTLTLEIRQSNPAFQQIPVTLKFRAKKGNMNEMVADMYGDGSWKDPTSYFMARDKKSNRLKLKYDPGRGYIEDSGSGDERADLS